MLHARLCGRQVRGLLITAVLAAGTALLLPPSPAAAADDTASAETLSRSGRHAEAGRMYEQQAQHIFRAWDTRLTLLAAREYLAAGRTSDAERMLREVEGPLRGDDAVLYGRVKAEIALANGNGAAALAALEGIPKPWPAPLATELLLLQAQADFSAGRTLDGIRAFEERARLLSAVDEREENYRLLVDALQRSGAASAVPVGATDSDRAWIELTKIRASTADASTAQRGADWRMRHPNHPGTLLLPQVTTGTAAGPAPPALPAGAPAAVALLLPLSGRQQASGAAVRDGFIAGYLAQPDAAPRVLVYDTAALGAGPAYQKALSDGAQFVVGPLTKEDVAALAGQQQLPVPTLALNGFGGGGAAPAFLYQYTLDPEQEAREVARRIAADGHSRGIALFPRSPWGERLSAAFTAELATTGVVLMSAEYYEPGTRDFSGALRAALGRFGGAGDRTDGKPPPRRDPAAETREGPQFAFIAATAQAARALRPQLRFQMTYDLPVYATSDAWDPSARAAADLEGMTFPEMPWILHDGQGAPALWGVLQQEWAAEGRGRLRLYAFGYDAVELMTQLRSGHATSTIDGLTGRLTLGSDGRVQRELDWARIEGGRPQPIGTLAAPPPSAP
jgi:hypothetical protein